MDVRARCPSLDGRCLSLTNVASESSPQSRVVSRPMSKGSCAIERVSGEKTLA